MRKKAVFSWLFLTLFLVGGATHAVPMYSLNDLGSVGLVTGINDVGQVIGYKYDANNREYGFLYGSSGFSNLGLAVRPQSINNSGQIVGTTPSASGWGVQGYFSNGIGSAWIDLGYLPGYTKTTGASINEAGHVLGFSYNSSVNIPQTFVSYGGYLSNIGTIGGLSVMGKDINDSGSVAGSATTQAGILHAFLFDQIGIHDLGTLGGKYSSANALNDSNRIAGYAFTPNGEKHAVTNNGYGLIDLGTLGGSSSEALAINAGGQIVGWADLGGYGNSHAFIYDNAQMLDLGTLGGNSSAATAINDAGDIVGWSTTSKYGPREAFIYSDGEMINLKTLLPEFTSVDTTYLFLNEKGQIAGSGVINGVKHGFLLTPVSAIPEPHAYSLLLLGLATMCFTRCLKKKELSG